MEPVIKDVHVQDLATVLEDQYSTDDLSDAFRRFDVDGADSDLPPGSILEGLRTLAEGDQFAPVLAYLLDEATWSADQIDALEAALDGSPLDVREADDGGVGLVQIVRGVADRSIPEKRDYLDSDAPDVIMTQVEAAESNLAAGEYGLAAAEIRRAFDMLVVSGFDEALEELASNDLIRLGSEHEHSDATMLYVAYGYCSFLGGDPESKGFETSRMQAELGVSVAEEVLYFLLRTLEEAEDEGIELRHWERP